MMKPLYRNVRVIHIAQYRMFEVQVRNWFRWRTLENFNYVEKPMHNGLNTEDEARRKAISRAETVLNSSIIWEQSNVVYY